MRTKEEEEISTEYYEEKKMCIEHNRIIFILIYHFRTK